MNSKTSASGGGSGSLGARGRAAEQASLDTVVSWLALSRQPAVSRRRAIRAWLAGQPPPRVSNPPAWIRSSLDWLESSSSHRCIPFSDPLYPALLRNIPSAPLVLFLRGNPHALSRESVALVGARRATPGGLENAHMLARQLSAQGLAVVSGLALGIDAAAHRGALATDGVTVAVLGSGPDQVYPRRNGELAEQILEHGALVSEFAPGTKPAPENFPRRNRIISGLAFATVVVEAGLRSGSLVTARLAAEQGREVAAVPGALQNAMAAGTNQILHDGAALVRDAADVLALLPNRPPVVTQAPRGDKSPPAAGGGDVGIVWAALEAHPVSMDRLQARTGWDIPRLAAALGELELAGRAGRIAGGYARTCFDGQEALVSPALCGQEN